MRKLLLVMLVPLLVLGVMGCGKIDPDVQTDYTIQGSWAGAAEDDGGDPADTANYMLIINAATMVVKYYQDVSTPYRTEYSPSNTADRADVKKAAGELTLFDYQTNDEIATITLALSDEGKTLKISATSWNVEEYYYSKAFPKEGTYTLQETEADDGTGGGAKLDLASAMLTISPTDGAITLKGAAAGKATTGLSITNIKVKSGTPATTWATFALMQATDPDSATMTATVTASATATDFNAGTADVDFDWVKGTTPPANIVLTGADLTTTLITKMGATVDAARIDTFTAGTGTTNFVIGMAAYTYTATAPGGYGFVINFPTAVTGGSDYASVNISYKVISNGCEDETSAARSLQFVSKADTGMAIDLNSNDTTPVRYHTFSPATLDTTEKTIGFNIGTVGTTPSNYAGTLVAFQFNDNGWAADSVAAWEIEITKVEFVLAP
jgi:hypothetical protein